MVVSPSVNLMAIMSVLMVLLHMEIVVVGYVHHFDLGLSDVDNLLVNGLEQTGYLGIMAVFLVVFVVVAAVAAAVAVAAVVDFGFCFDYNLS
ncbi:unnamed protein product [[Candida] boidinii]|nr:unnamed protein product [[Candida] boidinii]